MLSEVTKDKLKRIIGEEAFANFMKNDHNDTINEDKAVITTAFTWDDTDEGHEYWSELNDLVRKEWYKEDVEVPTIPEEAFKLPNNNISRRDYFAAVALQGILSSDMGYRNNNVETATNSAIKFADTLIAKLDKK